MSLSVFRQSKNQKLNIRAMHYMLITSHKLLQAMHDRLTSNYKPCTTGSSVISHYNERMKWDIRGVIQKFVA